jgi:hypothetical protein
MKKSKFTELIKAFDFETLFNELGWDNFSNEIQITVNEQDFRLTGIAEKKSFAILHCPHNCEGKIPQSNHRKQIESKVAKIYFEHLIIYTDKNKTQQIWQFVVKETNKPKQVREINWEIQKDTEILFQRLRNLIFTLDEEDNITIVDVKQRISENFAKNTEQVTKKFYTEFKKQHTAFLDFITGISDHINNKENTRKQWYTSLMLNRLMFCYFIQKRGFLDQNINYLQDKLLQSKELAGNNNFYSFYRSFLLELFHDGLGKPSEKRKTELLVPLGKVPYLNGGLFDVHKLEKEFDKIQISDKAFKQIFDFFDLWNWHLDNSIEASGKDINPDVIGFIFEKYINDRANMGAYYTKEDITDYIGRNTIIPFLFDETQRNYKKAFKSDAEIWQTLKNSNNTYIYEAVKKGVSTKNDLFADLPQEIKEGFLPKIETQIVKETTEKHLWQIRKAWNKKAPEEIALPTETYRELIERRKRYAEIISKIEKGEIVNINDFITYNLNIRQFAQDIIENTQDPDFIKAFFKAIIKVSILDPTCGSGAFLFAAMNILEPIYEACIIRMEQFVAEEPRKYKFFNTELAKINSEEHPNLQYYIFKSIILNNLHGVDLMNEAVEIAKLRLFLKLVATVDPQPRKENYGLEPLPDIDFNIRAGNTLVGFATEKELFDTIKKVDNLFAKPKLDDFKEEMQLVSKAYKHFQNAQLTIDQNSESHRKAKEELNNRLTELNSKLNYYLATNYGIDAKINPDRYKQWLITHQPFNWFAEFYNIIEGNGGFDVIIGNPPYVEYSKVKKSYELLFNNYKTINCGNIYAMVFERSILLSAKNGKNGLIVPVSLGSTKRIEPLLRYLKCKSSSYWSSFYAERPSKLFNGAEVLLNISIVDFSGQNHCSYTTGLIKWTSDFRKHLFPSINYVGFTVNIRDYLIPRFSTNIEIEISNKVFSISKQLGCSFISKSSQKIYYRIGGGRYWKIFTTFQPKFVLEGKQTSSSRENYLYFDSIDNLNISLIALSSSSFFWYFQITTNSRDLNPFDLKSFPINCELSTLSQKAKLLSSEYIKDIKTNKLEKEKVSKKTGHIVYEEFYPRKSKTIIDKIDTVLAEHYNFTEAELDFIINYDIKYRMGKELENYIEKND